MTPVRFIFFALLFIIRPASAIVILEDDRKSLTEYQAAAQLLPEDERKVWQLTPREVKQAMACLGQIMCETSKDGRYWMAMSATVTCPPGARKNGKCPADRIVTAGHGFADRVTQKMRPILKNCKFTNHLGVSSPIQYADIVPIDPAIPERDPFRNGSDRAVLRLKKKISGCDPYDITPAEDHIGARDKMLIMSDVQEGMDPGYSSINEPIVYTCMTRRFYSSTTLSSSVFFSDCDNDHGGSGAGSFVRSKIDGRWTLASVMLAQGMGRPAEDVPEKELRIEDFINPPTPTPPPPEPDYVEPKPEDFGPAHQRYSVMNGVYAVHTMIDRGFLQLLLKPGVVPVNRP